MKKNLAVVMACIMSFALVSCGDTSSDATTTEKTSTGFEEKVFVDDENCTFKITGIDEDSLFGYALNVELENKTDKNLMFSTSDTSVNGYMCDPLFATSVQAGKKAKSDMTFFSSSLEELGIETVEEIEFTLRVYDEDDWSAPEFVEETFTYVIKK